MTGEVLTAQNLSIVHVGGRVTIELEKDLNFILVINPDRKVVVAPNLSK